MIVPEINCSKCLEKKIIKESDEKETVESAVTLFCFRALVRCSVPCRPILLPQRLSVVSVCEK
jgi:hypothetical protein